MFRRIQQLIAITVIFCLVFEQSGFAQVASQMGIPAYLSGLVSPQAFRPIHLRSLTLDDATRNVNLLLDKGDAKSVKDADIKEAAKQLMDYFQTGLRLPNSMFWVNLRPDADRDIIDPYLEKTDVGRILLEADLQLKKDLAKLTSPKTKEGKAYWDKLYAKAETLFGQQDIEIPTLTRPWIVPGEVLIRQSESSVYVYKATLKVMLEQDYIKDSPFYSFTDPRMKEINEYSSQLVRTHVLPQLIREVNSAKRYAQLRQVHYSLVLAQWFKQRYTGKDSVYASMIDSLDLSGLTSTKPWSKMDYYKGYQRSFQKGEYDIEESAVTPQGLVIRRYFSGGIREAVGANTIQTIFQAEPAATAIPPIDPNIVQVNIKQGTDDIVVVQSNLVPEVQQISTPVKSKDGGQNESGALINRRALIATGIFTLFAAVVGWLLPWLSFLGIPLFSVQGIVAVATGTFLAQIASNLLDRHRAAQGRDGGSNKDGGGRLPKRFFIFPAAAAVFLAGAYFVNPYNTWAGLACLIGFGVNGYITLMWLTEEYRPFEEFFSGDGGTTYEVVSQDDLLNPGKLDDIASKLLFISQNNIPITVVMQQPRQYNLFGFNMPLPLEREETFVMLPYKHRSTLRTNIQQGRLLVVKNNQADYVYWLGYSDRDSMKQGLSTVSLRLPMLESSAAQDGGKVFQQSNRGAYKSDRSKELPAGGATNNKWSHYLFDPYVSIADVTAVLQGKGRGLSSYIEEQQRQSILNPRSFLAAENLKDGGTADQLSEEEERQQLIAAIYDLEVVAPNFRMLDPDADELQISFKIGQDGEALSYELNSLTLPELRERLENGKQPAGPLREAVRSRIDWMRNHTPAWAKTAIPLALLLMFTPLIIAGASAVPMHIQFNQYDNVILQDDNNAQLEIWKDRSYIPEKKNIETPFWVEHGQRVSVWANYEKGYDSFDLSNANTLKLILDLPDGMSFSIQVVGPGHDNVLTVPIVGEGREKMYTVDLTRMPSRDKAWEILISPDGPEYYDRYLKKGADRPWEVGAIFVSSDYITPDEIKDTNEAKPLYYQLLDFKNENEDNPLFVGSIIAAVGGLGYAIWSLTHRRSPSIQTRVDEEASVEKDAVSDTTESKDGGTAFGGIDLRTLPMTGTQSGAPAISVPVNPVLQAASLKDLEKQWLNIQKKMCSGPMPYAELKEFTAACRSRQDAGVQLQAVNACIVKILKMEECAAVATAPEFAEIIAVL